MNPNEPLHSPFDDHKRWISENTFAFAIRDNFPVSPGHTLVIPKRRVASVFELREEEFSYCWQLVQQEKDRLASELNPDGFNIGINDGEAAGQTVSHAHIHIIPRFKGDHPEPRGGVRAVIAGKASY